MQYGGTLIFVTHKHHGSGQFGGERGNIYIDYLVGGTLGILT